jgi:hypothetical protein
LAYYFSELSLDDAIEKEIEGFIDPWEKQAKYDLAKSNQRIAQLESELAQEKN